MSTSAKKLTQCFFYPKISAKFAPLNCICTYCAPMEVWQIVRGDAQMVAKVLFFRRI